MKNVKRAICLISATALAAISCLPLFGCADSDTETVVLRVANWEEYIDLGKWEDYTIDIANEFTGKEQIVGINSVCDDFVEWFNSGDYGFKVSVEYSTFGTNEDLYNRLNLGDVYDLICPSDYLIMKLIAENQVTPFSEEFYDTSVDTNYYAKYVSNYIDCASDSVFTKHGWNGLAACYMWGTTGIVYNPEEVASEDASRWDILMNSDYQRQVTIKDNVRDAYFVALAIANDELLTPELSEEERSALLNATDPETIAIAEDYLKKIKDNVYSFETDSGKADMVTGKVVANLQWSGDGKYVLDEADTDETSTTELWYSVPDSCTNMWFDGWIMLNDGINGEKNRQTAAEAFVNFLSRPDIAIRNMDYIGYTSAISGDMIYDYMDWNYGLDLDPESKDFCELDDVYAYDLSYFFGDDTIIYADCSTLDIQNANHEVINLEGKDYNVYSGGTINKGRQLFAQYPTLEVMERSVVMLDFGDRLHDINQMWINVRCLDLLDFDPVLVTVIAVILLLIVAAIIVYKYRYKIFKPISKIGYTKVKD